MELAAGRSPDDPALETLLLPLTNGSLRWPPGKRVLFLRARAGIPQPADAAHWTCEQGFRPFADRLQRAGMKVAASVGQGLFDLVMVLAPRQRQESRALLARAVEFAGSDGVVLASMLNQEGARSAESDLERLAGPLRSISKNRCRAFWSDPETRTVDVELLEQWKLLDAPRPIADGRFVSRPGLFAWDRIDAASALLAVCLPSGLRGHGADLGAGFGYLSAEILARCPGVVSLDLFEAEARALELARLNLDLQAGREHPATLAFHWHDVATGVPGSYDFIVSNPPFHQGRAEQPDLARAFIAAAAGALKPGGCLWLVANRHLPYETALAKNFAGVRTVSQAQGFKVIEAIRAGK